MHTQSIENLWGRLKAKLKKRRGIKRGRLQDYINEVSWLIENRNHLEEEAMSVLLTQNNQ